MNIAAEQLKQLLNRSKDESFVDVMLSSIAEDAFFEEIDGSYYCILSQAGIEIGCNAAMIIESIFLHSNGHEGFLQFQGQLPFELSFLMNQSEVRDVLGLPQETGGGRMGWRNLYIPPWDKYCFSSWCLHVTYSDSGSAIDLITLMLSELNHHKNLNDNSLPETGEISN